MGLKSDGTVVATGDNSSGQCNVSSWSDIVYIACGDDNHTLGLKSNGSVLAVGNNTRGQTLGATLWSTNDVVQVAAGVGYSLGLRSNGTLLVAGYTPSMLAENVSPWLLKTP